jgi:hypothetical protein
MPKKSGPFQLNEVKSRLRREQVARETAAALRYRQLEEREQARQLEEREHFRLLEEREHARQVRQTRVETSPSNYVLLALVVLCLVLVLCVLVLCGTVLSLSKE